VPYLLLCDTSDEPITHTPQYDELLRSSTLFHWWASDNEVLDSAKVDSLPLGIMDSLELGKAGNPDSVSFNANISDYLDTLRTAQAKPKTKWLMMQMTDTHSERRGMRKAFEGWGDSMVRLTPEHAGRLSVRKYLHKMGEHRFILSPRGNGLDAHRTWEALLLGVIPIVRSSALNRMCIAYSIKY